MSQASPLPRDWTEQRALCGYSVYVWQINLASLLAVLFVAFVGFYFSTPFIPFLVRQLGVTDPRAVAVWSGVLIGLGPASAAIASPLWGRLADRIGGRLLLVRTVFGFALINLLCALATSIWQLAALQLLMGTLGGFTAVALALASLSAPPESLTRAIAMAQSTQILGLMVGPALGGLLADHFGIRAAFVGSSGLAIIAGLNMLLVYHEPRSAAPQRKPRPKASLQALLRTPGFVAILIVLFAGSFTDRSYQPLIPLFVASLVPADGAVASLTGIIVAGGALAAALSANAASHLVPRFTHAQVLWGAHRGVHMRIRSDGVESLCVAAWVAARCSRTLCGRHFNTCLCFGGDDCADRAAVERVWRAEQWGDGRIGHGPHHGWHAGSGQPAWRLPVEYWYLLHRFASRVAWAGRAPRAFLMGDR